MTPETLNVPEAAENPACEPGDYRHTQEMIEAILFAAGHPMTYSKLGDVLGLTKETVRKIVETYAEEYNRPEGEIPRGIMLLTFPDSCQLCTREEFGEIIREALGIKKGGNLSQSSIETLAIIAYNEPVTRTYVETVRGVDTTYTIGVLVEKGLIAPCGRLDVPGRPLLYRTTPDFLRVFGLSSLEDLPKISDLSSGESSGKGRLFEEVVPLEGSEGDEESGLPLYTLKN